METTTEAAETKRGGPAVPAWVWPSDFEKIERAREGTFGVVWKAQSRTDPSVRFALKYRKIKRCSKGADEMYLREIDALEKFREHPHVLRLVCYDPLCLVTEWCSEKALLDVCGAWDAELCKRATTQLLDALMFVHYKNWVHRDVTPNNVFVVREGHVVLGDFGAAREVPPDRCMTRVVTARWYRAPILLLKTRDMCTYDGNVDAWSAACCVGELFTGEVQFPGTSDAHQCVLATSLCNATGGPAWHDTTRRVEGLCEFMDLLCKSRSYVDLAQLLKHPFLSLKSY